MNNMFYKKCVKKKSDIENKSAIIFNNVKKFFIKEKKEYLILKNLSFKIAKGKITTILGSSGAGKTTTAKIINGLETYNSGSIYINGVFLNKHTQSKIRKKTAFIFQNFNLFPHLSVINNILYTPLKVYHKDKKQVLIQANKLLKQFHLEHKADCLPQELSGGQKQRVAIIRALMLEPEILIMDEPTASLDPELTHEVINMIKNINRKGITVVIITHDIIVAKHVSDNILMLHGGKVIDSMSTKDFFNSKKEKSFFSKKFLLNCS